MGASSHLDDLTQEVFVKVWKALPRFSFRSSMKTWIYRIAVNTAIDHGRKKKLVPNDIVPVGVSEESEEQIILRESLADMELDERSLIVLFYYEGLTLKEISVVLEIPVGTVKSRLHHAREKLEEVLVKRGVVL
jgi:RNA polymerase sigma-70 factor (ECF subfamily)